MKKRFFYAICVMALATAVAIVSCKKEDAQNGNHTGKTATAADYTPGWIDDMNAYLKDFKGRMQNPTRGEDVMLSLEEAAWHLSSVANYDFGNANVEFTDMRYDTLVCHVNVTDGRVSMTDLGTAYAQVADAIENRLSSHRAEGENVRFVNASIRDDGRVTINLYLVCLDHVWYFLDDTIWTLYGISPYADSICHVYFSEKLKYKWNELGASELQRVLNLFESHPSIWGWSYFTLTRNVSFAYPNCPDPYGSPYRDNMRTYATGMGSHNIPFEEMCYCLDSYLGLGYDYLQDNPYVNHEHVISWSVLPRDSVFPYDHLRTYFHELNVQYGQLHVMTPGPNPK